MNEIKVRRLFFSGVITLLAFIAIEFIVESVVGNVLSAVYTTLGTENLLYRIELQQIMH